MEAVSTHDLTKRSTKFRNEMCETKAMFQLTTSRRGRHTLSRAAAWVIERFNSRPHEEVDHVPYDFTEIMDVSTHDLTKRSTSTFRSTALYLGCFNSRPHEEVDDTASASAMVNACFNSRPHEEVDGWYSSSEQYAFVSTHDLTKRSTGGEQRMITYEVFQLTTSRRGRQGGCTGRSGHNVSTHDLTKRSTPYCTASFNTLRMFQLTTSRRGRRSRSLLDLLIVFAFQLTTSRRGRRSLPRLLATHLHVSTHDLTKRSTVILPFLSRYRLVSTHDLTKRSTCLVHLQNLDQMFQLTTSRRGRR